MRKTTVIQFACVFTFANCLLSAEQNQKEIVKDEDNEIPSFENRKDAVFSTHGSAGGKAYSIDGKYYVCETEPSCCGNITVFDVKNDVQIQKWLAIPDGFHNDIKGLAWSPNSKRVAVMYHGGVTPLIQVFELGTNAVVATADGPNNYHFMVFNKKGNGLFLMGRYLGQDKQLLLLNEKK